ncbi:GIY-YIG nuclease family protein [Vibrio sp. ZSDZ34]|uniref:GIY-YIG nuclease family protein n=1 Tax=Vibrio gelatinilyticus TaxID=2893468 RepID=A0A9X2AX43_9VIBR|nr:GIY-YIG nuclease family protein [Vibrio gelatinilyticus]MCJ2378654.1 GIY-YIG nuclease family protein [Vibrio gelatinilyticus]
MKQPCVYILASKSHAVLYIGVTSNLQRRVWQHKNGVVAGFSRKYNVHQLVYYEVHQSMQAAILRERQLKKWKREWKENLINGLNPNWDDLSMIFE